MPAARFVRLETLEGVAAFHRQDRRQATASLQAAHGKLERLQVDDQALALLAGMGLPAREVTALLGAAAPLPAMRWHVRPSWPSELNCGFAGRQAGIKMVCLQ